MRAQVLHFKIIQSIHSIKKKYVAFLLPVGLGYLKDIAFKQLKVVLLEQKMSGAAEEKPFD